MKTCSRCKETKSLDQFGKRALSSDGLNAMCKVCKRQYDNNYYVSNENRKPYIAANTKARVAKIYAWLREYLESHPCIDCGESDIVVLEFDHRGDKILAVSDLARTCGIEKVQAEVAKCDVRCANCHRRKTARDFNYWRIAPAG